MISAGSTPCCANSASVVMKSRRSGLGWNSCLTLLLVKIASPNSLEAFGDLERQVCANGGKVSLRHQADESIAVERTVRRPTRIRRVRIAVHVDRFTLVLSRQRVAEAGAGAVAEAGLAPRHVADGVLGGRVEGRSRHRDGL